MPNTPPQIPIGRKSVASTLVTVCSMALLSAVALLLLPACSKDPEPAVVVSTPAPTPPPTPKPTPTPSPTPTPVATPTPTPVVRRTAPDGVFYVTEDITVKLSSGLMGVAPGTLVKLIKDNGQAIHVTDGTHDFDLNKTQVTNDLATARAIQKASADAQAAGDSFRAQQDAIDQQKKRDYIEFLRTHPLEAATPTPK